MATHHHSLRATDPIEVDRDRYNLTFHELGLEWYWDAKTYADLQARSSRSVVHTFVETHMPHLLHAYDADFLANAIESRRAAPAALHA